MICSTSRTTTSSEQAAIERGKNPQLTEYEIVRAQKIERNTSRMVELGLLSPSKAKLQVEAAWKISSDTDKSVKTSIQQSNESLNRSVNSVYENEDDSKEGKFVSYAPASLVPFLDKILEVAANLSGQDVDSISV